MEHIVRKAIQSDAPAILGLIRELALFEREPDAVVVTQEDIEQHGFGSHPLFECIVACGHAFALHLSNFYLIRIIYFIMIIFS